MLRRQRMEVHADEAPLGVVVEPPAIRHTVRRPQAVLERPLPVGAVAERQRLVQDRPEADVDHPHSLGTGLVGKTCHGERHVTARCTSRITIGALNSSDVPRHPETERAEEGRERAVQVVAVATAPQAYDPLGRLERVDRRAPAKLDLEVLVRNALDVRPV